MSSPRRVYGRLECFASVLLVVFGVGLSCCQRAAEEIAPQEPEEQASSSDEVSDTSSTAPKHVPMVEPEGPWQGHGEPGPGKISVVVSGDIKHPGQYFLEEGANLESIYQTCGGSGGNGDFNGTPPRIVTLNRNGRVRRYRMTGMTREAREAERLSDGDILTYLEIIF